jgi:ComF family protein
LLAQLVDSLLLRLLDRLLPPHCVLCRRIGAEPGHDLCSACAAELPRLAPRSAPALPPPCARTLAACAYAAPIDAMVQALKYGGQLALGRVLGQILAACAAELDLHRGVDCLLPVPLHPRRLAERGFNQSAEIARFAARRLALPVEPGLAVRYRDTRPQVGLTPAQRRGNLAGAFAVHGAVRGLHIAIVDDVITTGSTVTELARALHRAGAARVDVWCVARATPEAAIRGS